MAFGNAGPNTKRNILNDGSPVRKLEVEFIMRTRNPIINLLNPYEEERGTKVEVKQWQ